MSFFSDITLEGKKADAVEAMVASGGHVAPGFYRAVLVGAKEVTSQKGTQGCELTFEVTGGVFNGCTVKDTIWKTESEKTRDRIILFGLRLGVLTRDAKTQAVMPVEGKQDFMDVLDTKCIIEVVEEEYKRDDGSMGKAARIAFGGVYYADDAKAAAKIGKPAGSSGTGTGTGTGTTSKNAASASTQQPKSDPKGSANGKAAVDVSKL